MKTLEEVLEAGHARADVLREEGITSQADAYKRFIREVENATVDYRTWLSEDDAMFRSGRGRDYFRSRFNEWAALTHARPDPSNPRKRQYRQLLVPLRANPAAARDAGRRREKKSA